ncbi:hypothetical protein HJD18_09775 [Thermoleophilia bacterium SCSIO 60948]|nr:hypothetical protein HJD18_09775 [Thermoleophilia bacterium SCSIO 60948]
MNPEDPYRGLPSLSRLESDLERSERQLAKGWASRHMRLIAGAGAVLAAGFVVSPVGPAIGGGSEAEVRIVCDSSVKIEPGADPGPGFYGGCDPLGPASREFIKGAPVDVVTPEHAEPPGAGLR